MRMEATSSGPMDVGRLGFLQSTLVEVDAKIRQLLTT